MTLELAAMLVVLGAIGAFVSGLVGVGGAIVMIPLLFYVPPLLGVAHLDIKVVSAVTMVQVLAASVTAAVAHGRHAQVHRPLAVVGGVSMAAGSLLGAVGSRFVSGRTLLGVFAVMATVALPLMFVPPARVTEGAGEVGFSRLAAIGLMGLIGIMSGLVGAGGAFLTVPVLVGVLRIPVRLGIGTSLAMTAMSATMGALGKAVTGQVPAGPAVSVVVGSLIGAGVGALVSPRVPVGVLRGALVVVIAAVMIRVWRDLLFQP